MARVLVTVGAETRQDPFSLLDRPLWQLLYTFYHLEERATSRALQERRARVDAALMTALATTTPAALDEELRAVDEAIAAFERGPDDSEDLSLLRDRGEALASRIEEGRVLSPSALVP